LCGLTAASVAGDDHHSVLFEFIDNFLSMAENWQVLGILRGLSHRGLQLLLFFSSDRNKSSCLIRTVIAILIFLLHLFVGFMACIGRADPILLIISIVIVPSPNSLLGFLSESPLGGYGSLE
jgi:hypothetical protein